MLESFDTRWEREIAKLRTFNPEGRKAEVTARSGGIFLTGTKPKPPQFTPDNPPNPADFDLRQVTIQVGPDNGTTYQKKLPKENATWTLIRYGAKEVARRKDSGGDLVYVVRGWGSDFDNLAYGFAWFESLAKVALVFQSLEAQLAELRQEVPLQTAYRHKMELTAAQRQMLMDHPMFQQLQRPREHDVGLTRLVEVVPSTPGQKGDDIPHDLRVNMAYLQTLITSGFFAKAA